MNEVHTIAMRVVGEQQRLSCSSLIRRSTITVLFIVVAAIATPSARASVGGTIIKAISRYIAKEAGQEATEEAVKHMTKQVGEELLERTAQKVVREGGEKSLIEVGELVAKHGPDVIRALDNTPEAMPVLKLLNELPADEIGKVASRLAAGNTGKELATVGTKVGVVALRAEAKHPGIGVRFAKALGSDGAELSLKLTSDQAVQIGRHVEDIAQLPATQQSQLISMISSNADRFAAFVGRFVEKNPGKVLFTAASTTLILAQSERLLGSDEIVFDKEGNPQVVSKPGLTGRIAGQVIEAAREPLEWTMYSIGGVVAVSIALLVASFGGLVVWKRYKLSKLEVMRMSSYALDNPTANQKVDQ